MKSLALLVALLVAAGSAHAADHPMDPLSGDEMAAAVAILKDSGKLDGPARFPILRLVEMPKEDVLKWERGDRIKRRAEVQAVVGSTFHSAIVDLDKKKVTDFSTITDGKPILTIGDAFGAIGAVQADARWRDALKKRGIEKASDAVALPFFRGYFGNKAEANQNIYRVYAYAPNGQENYWGSPIEGLSAEVDVYTRKVLAVIDTGVHPLSTDSDEFNPESHQPLRRTQNPMAYTQDGGPSYTFDGNVVRWDAWEFHLRFEQQEGIVLSNVTFDGRSVLYQASVSELFVPYVDPDEHWYWRTFMDGGEGGLGLSASPMIVGVDCPTTATLLSPTLAGANGKGAASKDAVALYERYAGDPAWRHMDPISRKSDGVRAQQLVVRSVATVGNYDYLFDWIFDTAGGINVRVGATGICSAKGVDSKSAADDPTGTDDAFGRFVGEYTVAVNHDHFIAFRLDFDVDGQDNTFVKERLTPIRFDNDTPRISGWKVEPQIAKTENDAKLVVNPQMPTLWRMMSSTRTNKNGYATSYHIKPTTTNFNSLLDPEDWPQKRGAFSEYNLYVTPYRPNERYAGGATPNQNTGIDGLAVWSAADRPIENTDIVAWYSLGFHHVVRAEDWPVMPTSWHDFYIRPFDFGDKNPQIDLARE